MILSLLYLSRLKLKIDHLISLQRYTIACMKNNRYSSKVISELIEKYKSVMGQELN